MTSSSKLGGRMLSSWWLMDLRLRQSSSRLGRGWLLSSVTLIRLQMSTMAEGSSILLMVSS